MNFNIKEESGVFTLLTYEQLRIAFLKHGYWIGKSSCAAESRAEAAITDGLNSKSSIPTNKEANTMSVD